MTLTVRAATFSDLDTTTLYALLKLRTDTFVVEQRDPYPELDGRDLEPSTRHLWLARNGDPLGYLRILGEPDGTSRIGRVVVARDERGSGLGNRLMTSALDLVGHQICILNAQAHQVGFYARFGFVTTGLEYLDGHIPHVPMRRDP